MPKEKPLIMEGEVTQVLPNVMFRVLLDTTGSEIICYANGNLKRNFIKILEGDRVQKARIISRFFAAPHILLVPLHGNLCKCFSPLPSIRMKHLQCLFERNFL